MRIRPHQTVAKTQLQCSRISVCKPLSLRSLRISSQAVLPLNCMVTAKAEFFPRKQIDDAPMTTACASVWSRFVRVSLILLSCLTLVAGSTGCGTLFVTARAKGDPPDRDTEKELGRPPEPAKPAYWALLPFAIVYDVATSPIQIPMWAAAAH